MAAEDVVHFAVNRTLGTPNFKPLNEFITDELRVIASDTELYAVLEDVSGEFKSKKGEITYKIPRKLKMTRHGSLILKGEWSNWTSNVNSYFRIYRNSELINEIESHTEFSQVFSFSPGDIIEFEVYLTSDRSTVSTLTLNPIELYGIIKHNIFV